MAEVNDIMKTLEEKKKVLKGYKEKAEDTKNSRIRNEANLEHLKKSENDIVNKIKKLGYDPENLKSHIEARVKDLNELTEKLAKVMPDENGVIPDYTMKILRNVNAPSVTKKVEETEEINLNDVDYDDIIF
jgi:uncharacterized protein (UPF0335 family)